MTGGSHAQLEFSESSNLPILKLTVPGGGMDVETVYHPDPTEPTEPTEPRVRFRSWPLTLIARTIEGKYPDNRRVIPARVPEIVTIQENRKLALISWLRSLRSQSDSVLLTWETLGHVTLTQMSSDSTTATPPGSRRHRRQAAADLLLADVSRRRPRNRILPQAHRRTQPQPRQRFVR